MEDSFDFLMEEGAKPYNIRHRCFYFSKEIVLWVKDTHVHPKFYSTYNQMVDAALSVGANVIEGRSGVSKRDWLNFLGIALKSANEPKYWICLIRDTLETDNSKIPILLNELIEISNIIATMILNANKRPEDSNE